MTFSEPPPEASETPFEPSEPERTEPRVLASGHLHPGILFLRFLDGLRSMILPVALSFAAEGMTLLIVAGAIFLFIMAWGLIRYLTFQYVLNDEELVTREGLLHRQERRIPVNRIQDLSFESTLVRRFFGLVVVKVETASGKGAEVTLDSLARREAEALRAVLHRVRTVGTAGMAIDAATGAPNEAAAIPEEPEEVVYRVTSGELALRGLTARWLAPVVIGLVTLLQFAGEFEFVDTLGGVLGAFFTWLGSFSWQVLLLLSVLLLLMFLSTGIGMAIVAEMARFHRFTLTLKDNVLLRRFGLITTRSASLPRRKVQRVVLEQSFLRRLMGYVVVRADSAGSGANDQQEARSGSDIVAPLTSRIKADALVPWVLPGAQPWEWRWYRVSKRVIVRIGFHGAVFVAIAIGLLLPVAGAFAWLALLGLPAAVGVGFLAYSNLAYARAEEHVAMRWGLIGRYRGVVPFAKIQAVTLRAGPLERLLGLATVTLYVAGGSPTRLPDIPRAEAEGLREALAAAAAARRFVW